MALTPVARGSWNEIYEVSDQVLGILGKTVDKGKKQRSFDVSTQSFVGMTDVFIRREHQYKPESGPKRLNFQTVQNQPSRDLVVAISHKIAVSSDVASPYFICESPLLGEKTLTFAHEGATALDAQLQRLVPLSETQYAAENKGEVKSEVTMEFIIPKMSIFLTVTKPHRVDRASLAAHPPATAFVTEVVIGAKISGKIGRPADSPEAPKLTKSKKSVVPAIPAFTWEPRPSVAVPVDLSNYEGKTTAQIFNTSQDWLNAVCLAPQSWQVLWVRTQTAAEFIDSIPLGEEFVSVTHCGRAVFKPETILPDLTDLPGVFTTAQLGSSVILNFEFSSRARGVALVEEAGRFGDKITSKLTTQACYFCHVGMRGFVSGVPCSRGHLAVPILSLLPKRCMRCDDDAAALRYACGICDETGNLCGRCSLGGLAFCPQRHAVQPSDDVKRFIACDGCGIQGRSVTLNCSGLHFRSSLCSWCVGKLYYPMMKRALEPSPFEHCLAVVVRVRILNASAQVAAEFSRTTLVEYLAINDPLSLSIGRVFDLGGHGEFRFTLRRLVPDDVSPYKRVMDFMERLSDSGLAQVDIVQIDCVPVADSQDQTNDTALHNWLSLLK